MNYPSNITKQQFELIRPDLEMAIKLTRLRQQDLYELFRAVMHVLEIGCQWIWRDDSPK